MSNHMSITARDSTDSSRSGRRGLTTCTQTRREEMTSKVYRRPASVCSLLPCKLDIGSSTPCNKHPSKQVVKLRNRERARVQGFDDRFWSQGL